MLQAYRVDLGGEEKRRNVGVRPITSAVELIMLDSSRERLLM